MKFQSIKTSKLSKNNIYQILKLKNTNWKFSYNSQLKWFKENVQPTDYHNVMINNNKIVGYTFLGKRSFKLAYNNRIKKRASYILFSTLILNKKFRMLK